jgi:hypothetical protein
MNDWPKRIKVYTIMSELHVADGVRGRDGGLEGGREVLLDTGVSKQKLGDGITGLEGGRELEPTT